MAPYPFIYEHPLKVPASMKLDIIRHAEWCQVLTLLVSLKHPRFFRLVLVQGLDPVVPFSPTSLTGDPGRTNKQT